ncbi:MAG: hypothetical protein Q7T29_10940 [Gallionella sp.]|nr:hypothetical protein [Gallionella sp.]
MADQISGRPRWAIAAGLLAVAFGVVTVFEGGRMLFGRPEIKASAGNIVPFVLWFNFIAGCAYLMAGLGLWLWKRWAAQLSAGIAITTLSVFAAFGIHVALGGAFELKTAGAMMLRSIVWIAIAASTCRALGCFAATEQDGV